MAVCFALPLSFTACSSTSATHLLNDNSVYDRVMQRGKIRCGYVIDGPAGCLKDPNTGKLSGIGIEVLELAAKNLGLKIEWTEEVGWGSMIEGLQTNRYDLIATPVWTGANRALVADFSKPLYFSPVFAYFKTGNTSLRNRDKDSLNSSLSTIATVDGATAEIIAKEDFPKAKTISLPQLSDISQQLLIVSTRKADFTFVEPAVAVAFLKTNPGTIEPMTKLGALRVFPNCWMFRRGQMEFKNMIDTALDQLINSGTMDKIIKKYEPAPGTLYRVARPYRLSERNNK